MKNNYSDFNNIFGNESEYSSFSERDIEELNLLSYQHIADIISIIGDLLSYLSTIESINLIYSRYTNETENVPNPDIPAVQSLELLVISRFIYTQLGFIRFDHLKERKSKGEVDFSLEPDIYVNISNILRTSGTLYALLAAYGIYERDLSQPIIGI